MFLSSVLPTKLKLCLYIICYAWRNKLTYSITPSKSSNMKLVLNFSAVNVFTKKVLRNLLLPFVSIGKELFLIIHQLLVSFGCIFIVWSFYNGINWTSFLALCREKNIPQQKILLTNRQVKQKKFKIQKKNQLTNPQ